jgi:hypothetical protein
MSEQRSYSEAVGAYACCIGLGVVLGTLGTVNASTASPPCEFTTEKECKANKCQWKNKPANSPDGTPDKTCQKPVKFEWTLVVLIWIAVAAGTIYAVRDVRSGKYIG